MNAEVMMIHCTTNPKKEVCFKKHHSLMQTCPRKMYHNSSRAIDEKQGELASSRVNERIVHYAFFILYRML